MKALDQIGTTTGSVNRAMAVRGWHHAALQQCAVADHAPIDVSGPNLQRPNVQCSRANCDAL